MRRDLAARDAQVRAARQEAAQARAAAQAESGGRAGQPATAAAGTAPANARQGLMATAPQGGGGLSDTRPGGETTGQQNASTTPNPTPNGTIRLGGISVTLGGFVEAAGIFRTRNEIADIASNFNTGIPFPNSPLNHENEFRGSARQSRISLLAEGAISPTQKLAAYFETDFQGGSPTANQNESNSYNLRLRQAYGTYDNADLGLHVLGGQSWSLLTQQQVGITPRREDIPLTIDAQYAVGFNWARQPQIRVVKDFAEHKLWAGLSLEQPQNVTYVGPNGAGTIGGTANFQNPGSGVLASTVNYSTDIAPDVIAKVAYDPGFGHFEAFGIARFLHDRVSVVGTGRNNTTLAGGGGLAASVPFLGGKVSLRGSILAGYGLGRYGTSQLPDSVLSQSGAPVPLPSLSALVGVVGHRSQRLTCMAMSGRSRRAAAASPKRAEATATAARSTPTPGAPRNSARHHARPTRRGWSRARSAPGGASCAAVTARRRSARNTPISGATCSPASRRAAARATMGRTTTSSWSASATCRSSRAGAAAQVRCGRPRYSRLCISSRRDAVRSKAWAPSPRW